VHAAPSVGQPAPDFTLRDAGGKPVKLSDFRGKHVVLEWTNPGCPYVKQALRQRQHAGHAEARDRQGRGLAVDQFHREVQLRLPRAGQAGRLAEGPQVRAPTAMLMDEEGTAGKAYGARTTPHLYIIDPQGKLVYAGGIDSIPSSNADDIRKAKNDTFLRACLRQATDRTRRCG
jgi:peroxiredoxin